ncbi:uncharacterized protein LOC124161837 [Ischnura elegans]|uniref:uncharacterized protein LOC124161837 n=1 Tax=Ischnura elegans TaxID=197161 RepID=UPI001ED89228|nr:uncharacterized protein LOC124161837 [Ischnura elegans]
MSLDEKISRRTLTTKEFEEDVQALRSRGEDWNLTDVQINEIIEESLRILENEANASVDSTSRTCRFIRRFTSLFMSFWMHIFNLLWWAFITASILYCVLACHNPTQKLVTRHIQDYIYPFMRTFRLVTLPLLKVYPSLVDWHEEQCLVKNPFYKVQDLDCWPCEQVRSVLDLSGLKNFTEYYHHSGIPFVVKDAVDTECSLETLQGLFMENRDVFLRDAPSIYSSLPWLNDLVSLLDPSSVDAFNVSQYPEMHVTWKINRIAPARVLREAFPRPYFVPNGTEVAIQRFVFFNGAESPAHILPMSDFANVWILAAGSGERLISLWPASQCSHACSPTSIVLQPGHILFYNWQFWRPRSLPVQGAQGISILFMGSFY